MCKSYTGNFAKYLNPTEKMPDSLVPFLENIKKEMETLRKKFVKDLRKLSQNLYKLSINIPESIIKFIYLHSNYLLENKKNEIYKSYEKEKKLAENLKSNLDTVIGPYLANPFFIKDLNKLDSDEKLRNEKFLNVINETQFNLLLNEETNSNQFIIRLLNNFKSLLTLFDNFIFEEEYIILGDEEYFKVRQNYNELLKLKDNIEKMNSNQIDPKKNVKNNNQDENKYDLDSKRTFKKIFQGLNYNKGKINYYKYFEKLIKNYVENAEDKINILNNFYNKDNYSQNINGIKLQNNKNLYTFRNSYYRNYCDNFNKNINNYINYFNNERLKELEYKNKWNELVKNLKENLKEYEKYNNTSDSINNTENNEEKEKNLKKDNKNLNKKKK